MTQTPQTPRPAAPQPHRWLPAAIGSAAVAGVFSLAVLAILVLSLVQDRRGSPLNSPEMDALMRQPVGEAVTGEIRELDRRLRAEHFRRQQFQRMGVWLLAGGLGAFLLTAQLAQTLRRRLPMPGKVADDRDVRRASLARGGVAAAGVAVAVVAVLLALASAGDRQYAPINELALGGKQPATAATAPTAKPWTMPAGTPSPEEFARNWPRFRGPGGLGISRHANVPTDWDGATGRNILWKLPVPLPGENSPVVWENRVFLTGATKDRREVYCFSTEGKLLWRQAVNIPGQPAALETVFEDTGFAASTAATDGRRVYAMFANGFLAAFDFTGKQAWSRALGLPENTYGHAASLDLYRGKDRMLLLVQFDQAGHEDAKSNLHALHTDTGKAEWVAARPVANSWSTPINVRTGKDDQILTSAKPLALAHDAENGEEIWRAEVLDGDVAPSPVYADGLMYVVNKPGKLLAIRCDGKGNVSTTHVAWTYEDNVPETVSPVTDGKIVWLLADEGVLTALGAKDGKKLYEENLEGHFLASPTLVGQRLYLLGQKGTMFILSAGESFKLEAQRELGEDAWASPAFADGRIYIHGKKNLYCIGAK